MNMAPISPASRKRSTPLSDDDTAAGPTSKRRCMELTLSETPRPELELSTSKVAHMPLFDDEPRLLLLRSIAVALEHVGFAGASQEAIEAFCGQVDTYAAHFLSQITSSMLNARRSQPTPLDFKYALTRFDLPLASIEPHLKPPISPPILYLELEPLPKEDLSRASLALLLGNELSGESDKGSRPYIPKRFPSFPSKHTYKWTEKESARETDPRKIREEAAKTARQGEEALRRLVKVSKAGREKDVKRAASKDPKSKERHELWEKTMENLMTGKRHTATGKADQDDDRTMIVNSESQYFRKGITTKRTAPIPAEG